MSDLNNEDEVDNFIGRPGAGTRNITYSVQTVAR